MMKTISSKDNAEIKNLIKIYQNRKARNESNLFIVEGYNMVEEAFKAHVLKHVYTLKEEKGYKNQTIITRELMDKICDSVTPQGIIGLCEKPNMTHMGDRILYLDRIQDPGNLGTLIRSARAFNFDTIILNNTVDLYNPKTLRSSEGNLFYISFIERSIEELKKDGYFIFGTSMNGKVLEDVTDCPKKIVLILGNEGTGVSHNLLQESDVNLTISMNNNTESLNVGVAGSIIMHHLTFNCK